jgi:hypothetical protein
MEMIWERMTMVVPMSDGYSSSLGSKMEEPAVSKQAQAANARKSEQAIG